MIAGFDCSKQFRELIAIDKNSVDRKDSKFRNITKILSIMKIPLNVKIPLVAGIMKKLIEDVIVFIASRIRKRLS